MDIHNTNQVEVRLYEPLVPGYSLPFPFLLLLLSSAAWLPRANVEYGSKEQTHHYDT